MEGEAFDEANVEFAAVERLAGDGVEGAGGNHAVLDESNGGVIDFFAEIEADVEVRVRIALVRVFDERADGGDEGALDPVFGEDVAFVGTGGGGGEAEPGMGGRLASGGFAIEEAAFAARGGVERKRDGVKSSQ